MEGTVEPPDNPSHDEMEAVGSLDDCLHTATLPSKRATTTFSAPRSTVPQISRNELLREADGAAHDGRPGWGILRFHHGKRLRLITRQSAWGKSDNELR